MLAEGGLSVLVIICDFRRPRVHKYLVHGGASASESVMVPEWHGGRSAAEQYRRQGLAAAADAGQPADFIAVEFEYLYFLCRHQRAARLTGDAAALASASRAEAEFFRQHLSRWLPLFARDLAAAAAPAGAFARAGEALAAFCAEETGRLRRLG